ncbi:MAG: DUF1203 domain-containing protein, partial [Bacteroidota bacterium]
KITGIDTNYNFLFSLDQDELSKRGAIRMVVDEKPGYPCRVSLEDASIGEEVILFPYTHHETKSPYQASGPVFIRKNAKVPDLAVNEIPKMLLHRLLSLRVYDKHGMMIHAKTVEGYQLENEVEVIFSDEAAVYIQVHNSSPGCYNCQINRVVPISFLND